MTEREELLKRLREQFERNAILRKENERLVQEQEILRRRFQMLVRRRKNASRPS